MRIEAEEEKQDLRLLTPRESERCRKAGIPIELIGNAYYVYAHKTPDNRVFYVGKGKGIRLLQTGNRGDFWKRVVKKYGFIPFVLQSGLAEEEAYRAETWWIDYYKSVGHCEANFTLGGDGVRVRKRWWNEKISRALKGKKVSKGRDSPYFKDVISEQELRYLYEDKMLSTIEIGRKKGVSFCTIWDRLKLYGIKIRNPGRPKRPILCTTDNLSFSSMREAANFYKLDRANIGSVLNGRYKHSGGKHFVYITDDRGTGEGALQGAG